MKKEDVIIFSTIPFCFCMYTSHLKSLDLIDAVPSMEIQEILRQKSLSANLLCESHFYSLQALKTKSTVELIFKTFRRVTSQITS